MGLSKNLSYISMFAALIAVIIIGTGQQDQAKSLIGTDEAARKEVYSESGLGKANLTKDQSKIQTLMRATVLYSATVPVVNQADLKETLINSEPGSGLEQAIESGGTSIDIVKNKKGHQVTVFCTRPTVEYVCGAVDMDSRIESVETFKAPLNRQGLILGQKTG